MTEDGYGRFLRNVVTELQNTRKSSGRISQSSGYAPDWRIRGSNSGRDKGLSFPQLVETGSAVHPACYSNGTGFLSRE